MSRGERGAVIEKECSLQDWCTVDEAKLYTPRTDLRAAVSLQLSQSTAIGFLPALQEQDPAHQHGRGQAGLNNAG